MRHPALLVPIAAFSLAVVTAFAPRVMAQSDKVSVKDDPDQIGNRKVDGGWNFYSIDEEIALGKTLAEDIMRQARVIDDPVISEYVNRVGQNLARNSDVRVPLVVHVVEDDSINALALPGGYFFVNTGLILAADGEAEMAAAMAHEIAHIAARHGTRTDTTGQIASLATLPLIFAGGWGGWAARQAAQFAIPTALLKFSRGFEDEADNLGLQYMYKTGYDPVAYLEFFEKIDALQKSKPGFVHRLFESHPPTGDRIEHSQERIERNLTPRPEYVLNTSEFDRVKKRLAELINRGRVDPQQTGPTLRKSPGVAEEESADEKPTLKRRLAREI